MLNVLPEPKFIMKSELSWVPILSTYAKKNKTKSETQVDWGLSASIIEKKSKELFTHHRQCGLNIRVKGLKF